MNTHFTPRKKRLFRASQAARICTAIFIFSRGLAPLPAQEVWIAVRTDGEAGTGRRSDPFNGGTREKLDALLPTIAPGSSIHFEAGTYVTGGIQAKEGWRMCGQGKDATTIKLAAGTLPGTPPGHGRAVIFEYDFQGFLRYFELSDLTLDCNREQQPAFQQSLSGYWLEAWGIAAKSAKITNVRALGTWANPGEGFPCRVYHDGSNDPADRIEIVGCENLHPMGYLTAISVFDQSGGAVSGAIRRCLVTDHKDGSAFGAGGWRNFEVTDNVTQNVAIPIVIDTHDYRKVGIYRNRFLNCVAWGVLCNGGGVYEGIRICDNLFDMGPKAGPCVNTGNARVRLVVRRNTVVQIGAAEPIVSQGPHTVAALRGNVIRHRVIRNEGVTE